MHVVKVNPLHTLGLVAAGQLVRQDFDRWSNGTLEREGGREDARAKEKDGWRMERRGQC